MFDLDESLLKEYLTYCLYRKYENKNEIHEAVKSCLLHFLLTMVANWRRNRWHEHFNLRTSRTLSLLFLLNIKPYNVIILMNSTLTLFYISSNFDHATICWQFHDVSALQMFIHGFVSIVHLTSSSHWNTFQVAKSSQISNILFFLKSWTCAIWYLIFWLR